MLSNPIHYVKVYFHIFTLVSNSLTCLNSSIVQDKNFEKIKLQFTTCCYQKQKFQILLCFLSSTCGVKTGQSWIKKTTPKVYHVSKFERPSGISPGSYIKDDNLYIFSFRVKHFNSNLNNPSRFYCIGIRHNYNSSGKNLKKEAEPFQIITPINSTDHLACWKSLKDIQLLYQNSILWCKMQHISYLNTWFFATNKNFHFQRPLIRW